MDHDNAMDIDSPEFDAAIDRLARETLELAAAGDMWAIKVCLDAWAEHADGDEETDD